MKKYPRSHQEKYVDKKKLYCPAPTFPAPTGIHLIGNKETSLNEKQMDFGDSKTEPIRPNIIPAYSANNWLSTNIFANNMEIPDLEDEVCFRAIARIICGVLRVPVPVQIGVIITFYSEQCFFSSFWRKETIFPPKKNRALRARF